MTIKISLSTISGGLNMLIYSFCLIKYSLQVSESKNNCLSHYLKFEVIHMAVMWYFIEVHNWHREWCRFQRNVHGVHPTQTLVSVLWERYSQRSIGLWPNTWKNALKVFEPFCFDPKMLIREKNVCSRDWVKEKRKSRLFSRHTLRW